MVTIRLARGGSKKRPFYQIVAADKRFPLNGRYIESLGYYNPIARGQEKAVLINIDAVESYVAKGAQCSDRFSYLQNIEDVHRNRRISDSSSQLCSQVESKTPV